MGQKKDKQMHNEKTNVLATPSSQQTPKLTPSQNPSAKKHGIAAGNNQFAKNSNKKLIKNSLNVCLAGETNKVTREDVIKILESTEHPYYIILFRGNLGR